MGRIRKGGARKRVAFPCFLRSIVSRGSVIAVLFGFECPSKIRWVPRKPEGVGEHVGVGTLRPVACSERF